MQINSDWLDETKQDDTDLWEALLACFIGTIWAWDGSLGRRVHTGVKSVGTLMAGPLFATRECHHLHEGNLQRD